jgi:hypothetical protein
MHEYVKEIKEETAGGGPTCETVPLSLLVAMSAGHVNHRERDQFMIPGITVPPPPPPSPLATSANSHKFLTKITL